MRHVLIVMSLILLLARTSAGQPISLGKVFEPDAVDIGTVKENSQAPFEIKLRNITTMALSINEIETSCGCTVVEAPSTPIAPAETVTLKGSIDTSGKVGLISKTITIHTNELPFPHVIALTATVEHAKGTLPDTSVIFKGDCASCHVGENIGSKQGEALYISVCALCHKEGLSGEAANSPMLVKNIAEGVRGVSMPGFAKWAGGPLSQEQIEGLAAFIQTRFGK